MIKLNKINSEELIMKFEINSAEAERQKTLKFAEDNNISDDEVNSVYNEIYSQLSDDLSDSAKDLRALRKTRGALRKIANNSAKLTFSGL